MFTKLKQKIAEEDHSDLGSSVPSSPSSSRKFRPVSKENKWHRRRMNSVSSYYGSRESLFTESGLISRDPSFTSHQANGLRNALDNSYVSNNKPRKDLVSVLREKTQEIDKLKNKLSVYEEEIERWKGLYEEQSIREQELAKNIENKFQMSHTQIDARQKALDILEKGSQLDEIDQAYKDQKTQLSSMLEKLDELTKQRCDFEEAEQKLKQQTSKLETENKTLKGQLNDIITEVTQKSVELSKVQKCLELRETELNELQETYNSLKTQTSAEISEKENKIKTLENRLSKSDSSHSDLANMEDEWMPSEGKDKSSEINALATLVGSLNEKLERKDKELTSCKRVAEETIDELKEKIKSLERDVEKSQIQKRSNDQLDALKQRNSYLEKELENVRSQLTSAKRLKDNRATWRRSNDVKPEERSRYAEKEFRQREARYESQLADLQEERDQLHSELLIKDEECAQVSLCLDEALKNTNDLKLQIKNLEEALEEKTNVGVEIRVKSSDGPALTANVEIMEALRQELEQSRERNNYIDDELHERDDTITSLRNVVRQKDDELRRCKTTLAQFEENNKLADRKRIIDITSSKDDYRHGKDSHKQSFAHKTRLKELEDQLQLREDVERISMDENESLRRQINEKDLRIKTLQQKLVDLKKAFQRELKSSSLERLEVNGTTESHRGHPQAGLLVSSSTQTDNEDLEYLNMNFKYLKHVIIKYLCSTNEKSRQMLPILGHLLRLTAKELDLIKDTFEWKLPLD